jgi:GAF domain-containing protein
LKSTIGFEFEKQSIPREHSLDALLMFPETPEIKIIFDMKEKNRYSSFKNIYELPNNEEIQFYAGVVLVVEGFRLGVLSIVDTEPRTHFSMEDRQNLLDLASAISGLLKERREKLLRLKKEKTNLLLGLNHTLRTPVRDLFLLCFYCFSNSFF